VQIPSTGSFRGCHFEGDAEFRFCRIGEANFGDKNNVTVISGIGDFRSCTFLPGRANFEYIVLRGESSFVDTTFGRAGASFRFAHLAGTADFNYVNSQGPLDLNHTYIPALRFQWQNIRDAVVDAHPDTRTYAMLNAQSKASGDLEGVRDTSFLLERERYRALMSSSLPDF